MLCTVFFCVCLLFNGCKTTEPDMPIKTKASLLNKYIVNFNIKTQCHVSEYYKDTQTIFFPILRLNPDGSLLHNYNQSMSSNRDLLMFSSNDNIDKSIRYVANQFYQTFQLSKSPKLYQLPVDLKKAYLVRFYYYINNARVDFNSVYLKSSIEYLDINDESQLPINIWMGEAFFSFDKSIDKETSLDIAIKHVMKYAFKNHRNDGSFHILNL